jgi:hypothetical protein
MTATTSHATKTQQPNRRYPGKEKVQKPEFWSIQLHCEQAPRWSTNLQLTPPHRDAEVCN